jgi:hypothetical protein
MLRTLLSVAAALPLLMGCSIIAQADDLNSMSPQQLSLIDATCTHVMGFRYHDAYYLACQDSLSHSLARRDAAYRMVASDDACSHQGLKPGSAALASCMLDHEGRADAAPVPQPVAFAGAGTEPGKSYYDVTNGVKFQRERYSCAQLGLVPNSGLFGQCVASLEGALLPDPN